MQIAQTSLTLLDVGFHDIARITETFVSLVSFRELGLHEVGTGRSHDLSLEAPSKLTIERGITAQIPCLQQTRADRDIGPAQAHALIDRPGGMPHLKAEIPKHIQQILDDLLPPRRLLVRKKKQQIDIRERRHLTAAVSPNGNDRKPLAGGRIRLRVNVTHRKTE